MTTPETGMRFGDIAGVAKPVPRLIQGGAHLHVDHQDRDFKLLDDVFALGCHALETARTYGGGTSEKSLGAWIRSRGVRDAFVIMTKGGKTGDGRPLLHAKGIGDDVAASLDALRTDHIDVWMLHRDDETVDVGTIVEILNKHRRAGRIRAFGGSNWSDKRVRAANEYAARNGLVGFACSSPNFSLAEQFIIPWEGCRSIAGDQGTPARAWYAATKLPVVFWSSMAGGFFSGRFTRDNLDAFTEYWQKSCVDTYCREPNFRRLDHAQALAARRGVTAARIAMAYVLCQPMNVFCLTSAASGAEMRDSIGAFDVQLSPAELAWLETGKETLG